MPVGIQRLNARKSQPNPHIVFIKPLKGPDEEASRAFLERIAAQCVPIMREHHLSVVTLEEYEPNASFVGRNFNAGEVIQLVLKARFSGRWLPFSYVQMVMMHELAHCRHMNHARAFWAVRNEYAAHMRRLWAQDYTGEGIWGRGARLGTAAAASWARFFSEQNTAQPGGDGDGDGVLLEHLCGGTYRSRGRLRNKKRKPALTYREQQERRIRRKFGENGVSLGGDVAERAKLEGAGLAAGKISSSSQKRVAVNPRVAKSKRGRDLRAAAALARFEQNMKEEKKKEGEEHNDDDENQEDHKDVIALIKQEAHVGSIDDDDNEEDDDDESTTDQELPDAVDIDGTRLVDGQGRGMVRVCEDDRLGDRGDNDDDDDDADAKRELRELLQIQAWRNEPRKQQPKRASLPKDSSGAQSQPNIRKEIEEESKPGNGSHQRRQQQQKQQQAVPKREPAVKPEAKHESEEPSLMDIPLVGTASESASALVKNEDPSCPVCSLANRPLSVTCAMCAHVLLPDADPSAWRCGSAACSRSSYLNAGDCGVCGVCGQRRE